MTEQLQRVPTTPTMPERKNMLPNRWKGERGCLVGPFSDMSRAQLFEHYVVHQAGVSTPYGSVHQSDDGWYIAVPG